MSLGKKLHQRQESFLAYGNISIGDINESVSHDPDVCELNLFLHASEKLDDVTYTLFILTDNLNLAKHIIIVACALEL